MEHSKDTLNARKLGIPFELMEPQSNVESVLQGSVGASKPATDERRR